MALATVRRIDRELGDRGERVAQIQRVRLLRAAVGALGDVGFEQTTVAQITRRARVSRRTFYELFANREQCIAAALEQAVEQVREELRAASLAERPWRERMRLGLWTILCFLEREPALARMLIVDSARGSGPILEARERVIVELVAEIDRGRHEGAHGGACSELTAEAVVGGALTVLHGRLAPGRSRPAFGELLGELSMLVLLPYEGTALARREQARPAPAAPQAAQPAVNPLALAHDPMGQVRMRVTYRTARVLEGVARHPGASNRTLADHAGISDQGQVSKLLGRLERLGLVENRGAGHAKGEPNAWTLTPVGVEVAGEILAQQGEAQGQARPACGGGSRKRRG